MVAHNPSASLHMRYQNTQRGECICIIDGDVHSVNTWISTVAKHAETELCADYHHGKVRVLHIGDAESKKRVTHAIDTLKTSLFGTLYCL